MKLIFGLIKADLDLLLSQTADSESVSFVDRSKVDFRNSGAKSFLKKIFRCNNITLYI